MLTPKEYSIHLLNNAILQTYSLSYEMKLAEAKEIVFNQLNCSKFFLFEACTIENKHCKKTLQLIIDIKNELEKLDTNEVFFSTK